MKRLISIFLFATLLLQSCHAYYHTSVSLNEAYESKGKVKATSTINDIYYFKNIELKDSIYYGVKERDKGVIRIEPAQISDFYLENLKKSKRQNIILFIVLPSVMMGAAVLGIIVAVNSLGDLIYNP